MQRDSLKPTLAAADLFHGLSEVSLERLAARARRIRATPSRLIVNAGDEATGLYLIESGAIKLAVANVTGFEKTIATLDEMKSFGLAEFFSGRQFRYYAEALTETWLIAVPGASILDAANEDSGVLLNLVRALARHFDALAGEIENANRYTAFQRVVNGLLMRAEMQADGTARLELPGKKSHTASRLGVAAETFSRSLTSLSERGLITVRQRTIVLHDVHQLQALLWSEPVDARHETG